MSNVDVTQLIADPDFQDSVSITYNGNTLTGNAVLWPDDGASVSDWFNGFAGLPTEKLKQEAIHFVTTIDFEAVFGAGIIAKLLWRGREYFCRVIKSYSHWGAGFIECVAVRLPALYPHKITVWAEPKNDGLGDYVWSAPVVLDARIAKSDMSKSSEKGYQNVTANKFYTSQKIAEGSRIKIGEHTGDGIDGFRVTSSNAIADQTGTFTEFECVA